MTEEQQCKALGLLKRAVEFAPSRKNFAPQTRKSLGDQIEDFLHEIAETADANEEAYLADIGIEQ